MSKVRKFKILNGSELDYLKDRIEEAARMWSIKWFCEERVDITLKLELPSGALAISEMSKFRIFSSPGIQRIGFQCPEETIRKLYNTFLGIEVIPQPGTGRDLMKELVDRSLVSLLLIIYSMCETEVNRFSGDEYESSKFFLDMQKPGAGYIYVHLCIAEEYPLSLYINANDLLPSQEAVNDGRKIQPALDIFGNCQVQVSVILGELELQLEELTNISVGDIVTTEKKLSEKLSLQIDDKEFCRGYLGKNEKRLTIKIAEYI